MIHFFFLANRKPFNTWVAQTSLPLCQHTQTHTHAHRLIHTNTYRIQDISQAPWLWVFISLSFSFCSFIILSPLLLSPLSFPALLFFIFSPSLLYSVTRSSSLPFFLSCSHISPLFTRSISSLRLAVFIFQSFISTNVRQRFCPPSIDPEREKEMGGERGRTGEEGLTWSRVKTRLYGCDGKYEPKEWESSNKVREREVWTQKWEEVEGVSSIKITLSIRSTTDWPTCFSPYTSALLPLPTNP